MPARSNQSEQRAEDAREQPAPREQRVEVLLHIGTATANAMERAIDRDEDDQIHDCDRQQEQRGRQRANDAAHVAQCGELLIEGHRGRGDGDRREHHDGRMSEGEEQPDGDRALTLLHQLARDVVDRGDVVGVDGVPQAEAVG